ncbi:hypothetical protein U0070_008996, partial [Myodes glareolus]
THLCSKQTLWCCEADPESERESRVGRAAVRGAASLAVLHSPLTRHVVEGRLLRVIDVSDLQPMQDNQEVFCHAMTHQRPTVESSGTAGHVWNKAADRPFDPENLSRLPWSLGNSEQLVTSLTLHHSHIFSGETQRNAAEASGTQFLEGEGLEAGDATTQPHCPQKHCFLAHEASKHTAHSPEGHRIKAGPSLSTSNAGLSDFPFPFNTVELEQKELLWIEQTSDEGRKICTLHMAILRGCLQPLKVNANFTAYAKRHALDSPPKALLEEKLRHSVGKENRLQDSSQHTSLQHSNSVELPEGLQPLLKRSVKVCSFGKRLCMTRRKDTLLGEKKKEKEEEKEGGGEEERRRRRRRTTTADNKKTATKRPKPKSRRSFNYKQLSQNQLLSVTEFKRIRVKEEAGTVHGPHSRGSPT